MITTSLSNIMLKDHQKIVEMLEQLEKEDHHIVQSLSELQWHLEKHIFVEEKAIYISYQPQEDTEEKVMFEKLSEEHTIILNLLDKIMKESLVKGNINFTKMKKLLIKHKNFEEEQVYPKLENFLCEDDKKAVIEKIHQIL